MPMSFLEALLANPRQSGSPLMQPGMSAKAQGLLGAGAALLDAGRERVGPPVGFGGLGAGVNAGISAYQQAQQNQFTQQLARQQYKLGQQKQAMNAAAMATATAASGLAKKKRERLQVAREKYGLAGYTDEAVDAYLKDAAKAYNLGEGQTRYRGDEEIAAGPPKPITGPKVISRYINGREQKGYWKRDAKGKVVLDADNRPTFIPLGSEKADPGSNKNVVNMLLPDGQLVNSRDGGRTYMDPTGKPANIPAGAIRVGADVSAGVKRSADAATRARERIGSGYWESGAFKEDLPSRDAATSARKGGTGPWSNLQAAADAVLGGVFDADIQFPDTADNRQHLRLIAQKGKSALLNSARGAIWEQQKIERLFPNPDTFWTSPEVEARKIPLMRQTLVEMAQLNDRMLSSGHLDATATAERLANNAEIRKTLALVGSGEGINQNATGDFSTVQSIEVAPAADVRTYVQSLSAKQIDALPPEIYDALEARMR